MRSYISVFRLGEPTNRWFQSATVHTEVQRGAGLLVGGGEPAGQHTLPVMPHCLDRRAVGHAARVLGVGGEVCLGNGLG